jgi:hypothetical protein
MTATWPDIAYPIGHLSRYNHEPRNELIAAFNGVFRFLNGTKVWRLRFRGKLGGALGLESDSALRCYID